MDVRFTDIRRENREVRLYVWYPAVLPADAEPSAYNFDAEPDFSGAPYPLILSSARVGMIFGGHLASHGFVVVGVDGQDSKDHWGPWLIDYPRDLVFALDQISAGDLEGMEGLIDAEHAGAMGYSFDGYNALSLSGARIDPENYLRECASAEPGNPYPEAWWIDYICNMDGGWDAFVAHAGAELTASADGLWQPLTDDRIRAVMPMAPEGAWLFGETGLRAADRPALILAATRDDINYYDLEAVPIFEGLGSADKTFISFVDQDHMMIFNEEQVAIMKHLSVAFFGHYLQGQSDYRQYFAEDRISKQENLEWGISDE